jgi:hypothetical protein
VTFEEHEFSGISGGIVKSQSCSGRRSLCLRSPIQVSDSNVGAQSRKRLAHSGRVDIASFLKGERRGSPWKMGNAPSQVRPGDLVCWIKWIRKAIIVRVHEVDSWRMTLQIFSTALVAEDLTGSRSDHKKRLDFKVEEAILIIIDVRTIFVLLAQNSHSYTWLEQVSRHRLFIQCTK